MKITPCGHRVLVKLKVFEEKTESGIIIATEDMKDAHQRAMQEAYVVSLGPTAFKDFGNGSPWCRVNDLVLISKYSGEDRIDPDTKEVYRIINDEDVFAILEE